MRWSHKIIWGNFQYLIKCFIISIKCMELVCTVSNCCGNMQAYLQQNCQFPCRNSKWYDCLTHWCQVTHICVCNLIIIGSDNGLSPGQHQTIIWTNVGILLIGPFSNEPLWFFYLNWSIFIKENAFESVVWAMATYFAQPQHINMQNLWYRLMIISLSNAEKPCWLQPNTRWIITLL